MHEVKCNVGGSVAADISCAGRELRTRLRVGCPRAIADSRFAPYFRDTVPQTEIVMKAHSLASQNSITPLKALEILQEGNQRFVNNLKASRNLLQQVNNTREGQWPFAVILSCIDSRTSAELIFDQGLGDIFSIRIAGNIVNTDIIGSIEFACKIAGSKLIVVMGHSKCGAIKGACDHVEMGNLTELLAKIQPAVYEEKHTINREDRNSANEVFVENVAGLNVKRSVKAVVERSFILEQMITKGEIGIIGAKHDLESGAVEFYQETMLFNLADVKAKLAK